MNKVALTPDDPLAVVLMVEPGYLEFQSICLIASFARFCTTPYRFYPYCREDRVANLCPITREFLEAHCQPLGTIDPQFASEYPQGNKIYACAAERPETVSLFLDTDLLMLRETDFAEVYRTGFVSVVLGSITTWTNDPDKWEYLYSKFDLPPPNYLLARGADSLGPPYFNGGFIMFDSDELPQAWLEIALACDFDPEMSRKRPWLDQVTLPLAIAKAGLCTAIITPHWNGRASAADYQKRGQHLLHYHKISTIGELGFSPIFDDIVRTGTDFPDLLSLLDALKDQGGESLRKRDLTDKEAATGGSKEIVRTQLRV